MRWLGLRGRLSFGDPFEIRLDLPVLPAAAEESSQTPEIDRTGAFNNISRWTRRCSRESYVTYRKWRRTMLFLYPARIILPFIEICATERKIASTRSPGSLLERRLAKQFSG